MHVDDFRSTQPAYLRSMKRIIEAGGIGLEEERVAIERALRGAVRRGDTTGQTALLFFRARNLFTRNDGQHPIAYERALAHAIATGNQFWRAITLIQRGAGRTNRLEGLRELWEGIELLRPIEGAELDLLRARLSLAFRIVECAPEFAARVLDESPIDEASLGAFECNQLGAVCCGLGRYDAALRWFDRTLELAVENHPFRVPFAHLGSGIVYSSQGDHRSAIACFRQALQHVKTIWHRPRSLVALARSLLAVGESAEAERELRAFVDEEAYASSANARLEAFVILAEIVAPSDSRYAIECLERAIALADLARNEEAELNARRALVDHLRAVGDRDAYDLHIVAYTEALERARVRGAAADLEQRRIEVEIRTLTELLNDRESAAREQERTRELTAHELARQASTAAAFADSLQSLKADLLLLLDGDGTAEAKLGSIRRAIDRQAGDEPGTKPLEVAFTSINPEFGPTLRARFPGLTKEEIRVCMLLRMRLSSVDIARYLNRSPRSIENHRFRIRRKMALDRSASISDALAALA
jgi:tetratricopeptide (TPR) repeat protein/DNA-binding CsgD family transcriptional regulator